MTATAQVSQAEPDAPFRSLLWVTGAQTLICPPTFSQIHQQEIRLEKKQVYFEPASVYGMLEFSATNLELPPKKIFLQG